MFTHRVRLKVARNKNAAYKKKYTNLPKANCKRLRQNNHSDIKRAGKYKTLLYAVTGKNGM